MGVVVMFQSLKSPTRLTALAEATASLGSEKVTRQIGFVFKYCFFRAMAVFHSSSVFSSESVNLLMIEICFGGSATENSKLSPATFRQPGFESLPQLPEKAHWPPLPVFGQRVSDKVVLCQLAGGFQTGLDISSSLE